VSTHIETAADFHNAVTAGVDEINHMPGFRMHGDVRPHPVSTFEVSEADAREAARRGTYVITTLAETGTRDAEQDALNVRNLKVLHAAGVRLAIGSDSYRIDSLPEAPYIASLHAFDNLTLLKIWTEATAQTIFPKRRIGFLKEGYEANFIVLDGDPLQDFSNVTRIRLRVKHGGELSIPGEEKK
jgi:imidazolonepropionase-like amidohydrolase